MSLVTLNEYLKASKRESGTEGGDSLSTAYIEVATRMLAAMRKSVFCGEKFLDLFAEADAIRKDLHGAAEGAALSLCVERTEEILTKYETRLKQFDNERAADLRSVMDMLNEGFSYLTSDLHQSETRRQALESDLSAAARVDDITVLRRHLAKMLQSVRADSIQAKDKAEKVINSMGRQIQMVHKAQAKYSAGLPERTGAIDYLNSALSGNVEGIEKGMASQNLYLAFFVADSLPVIRQRHGEEVAGLILQDIGRKQVQSLAPDGQVFCWASNALLLGWQHTDGSIAASEVAAKLRSPCEQRAFVGSRVAIFNITLRTLVLRLQGTVEDLIGSLDRFHRRAG